MSNLRRLLWRIAISEKEFIQGTFEVHQHPLVFCQKWPETDVRKAVLRKLLGSQHLDFGGSFDVIPTVFEFSKLHDITCAAMEAWKGSNQDR
jgi:hypothetical protein